MNWLQILLRALSAAPAVIIAVEGIAKGAPGATKKTLAMQSLGLGQAVAATIAPEHKEQIDLVSSLVSQQIDNTVAIYNAIGKFETKTPQPTMEIAPASY